MPELPEVETIRRELVPHLLGRTIVGAQVKWAHSVVRPSPTDFVKQIRGESIKGLYRRGKYLLLNLSSGVSLILHLGMTGALHIKHPEEKIHKHTHVIFYLDDSQQLRFVDPRKFGRLYLVEDPEDIVGRLGPEPLNDDFNAQRLATLLQRRRGRLKPLLLNQRFLAGLGNIYTDEALFRAQLHPLRTANTLSPFEIDRLYLAIRQVLTQAIAQGGSTLPDGTYRRPDEGKGEHQEELQVFQRTGLPCPCCGSEIERMVVGGRGTHLCPACQRL